MKNRFKIAATAALAAMLLVACGNGDNGNGGNDAGTDNGGNGGDTSGLIGGDRDEVDQGAGDDATVLQFLTFVGMHATFMEEMAYHWNELNPDRQIILESRQLGWADMHTDALLAIETGIDIPDIIDIEIGRFSDFVRGAHGLYDLTPYAAPFRADLVEARLELYTRNGQLFGAPTHVGATLAFYNVPLLEEADIDWQSIATWDDFEAAGIAFAEATGNCFGTADTSASWQTHLLVAQHGGDYVAADGTLTMTSDAVVAAVETQQRLAASGAQCPIPGGQPDNTEAFGAINNGDFAALIMPMWYMSRFLDQMPELSGQIAIAAPPQLPNGAVATVGGGGTGTAVSAASEHRELAAEFVAFAKLSPLANVRVWEVLGFDPVNTAVWTDTAVTHNPDIVFNQYFYNNAFDALNPIADSIGLLESQKSDAWPIINQLFTTETLINVLEDGMDVRAALEQTQGDLDNQLRN
ncbi:MAG: ABC transporter substrate-binding protein [Promicromonosporaceae bacterium]|nr:ABC transporter substrate-binding protein [Promicromonosporaceae bacterium]